MSAPSAEGTEPELQVDAVGRGLQVLGVGAALVAVAGLVQFGAVALALQESSAATDGLAAVAARMATNQEYAVEEFAPVVVTGVDVKLGTLHVGPDQAAKPRSVRVSVVLTVTDAERFELYPAARVRARDLVVTTVGARTVEELSRPGGAEAVRATLRRLVKRSFPTGLVTEVHFSEFVVQ